MPQPEVETRSSVEQFLANRDNPPEITDEHLENVSQYIKPEEAAQLTVEAMNPEASIDSVKLGDKLIPIRFIPMKYERKFKELIAGMIAKASGLSQVQGVEGILNLIDSSMDTLLQAMEIIAQANKLEDLTPEWLEENVSTMEIMPVIAAQLAKYKQADALGKLLRGFVQGT